MRFTKMHGCGNDYIIVNGMEKKLEEPIDKIKKLSDRHFGIGSDGLIEILPSKLADFKMEMYNVDGSKGAMCGNGIRCLAKYVYEMGLTSKKEFTVETGSGVKLLELHINENIVKSVCVNMGKPEFLASKIPAVSKKDQIIREPIEVGGKWYRITCVSMGNPHGVLFVPSVDTFPVEKIGALLECHEWFPNRINAEFVHVLEKNKVRMRVWERGSGETLACGTGACAAVMAGIRIGKLEDEVIVELPGGILNISYEREQDTVYLTGEAAFVYHGEVIF